LQADNEWFDGSWIMDLPKAHNCFCTHAHLLIVQAAEKILDGLGMADLAQRVKNGLSDVRVHILRVGKQHPRGSLAYRAQTVRCDPADLVILIVYTRHERLDRERAVERAEGIGGCGALFWEPTLGASGERGNEARHVLAESAQGTGSNFTHPPVRIAQTGEEGLYGPRVLQGPETSYGCSSDGSLWIVQAEQKRLHGLRISQIAQGGGSPAAQRLILIPEIGDQWQHRTPISQIAQEGGSPGAQ
jgi:hypothetical protein